MEAESDVSSLANLLRQAETIPLLDLRRLIDGGAKSQRNVIEGCGIMAATGTMAGVVQIDSVNPEHWEFVRLLHEAVPGLVLGVGWIRLAEELPLARNSGCAFALSPGLTFALHEAAEAEEEERDGVWLLPAIQTISEGLSAWEADWRCVLQLPINSALTQASGTPVLGQLELLSECVPELLSVVVCDLADAARVRQAGASAALVPVDMAVMAAGEFNWPI